GGSTALSSDQVAGETVMTFDLSACSAEFAVTTVPPVLVPQTPGTATVDVTFTPATRGAKSCTVTMRDAGATAIGTFQITGTGVAQELTITTPAPLDLSSVRVTTGA